MGALDDYGVTNELDAEMSEVLVAPRGARQASPAPIPAVSRWKGYVLCKFWK